MYLLLVILRLVHILAGTFWVGAALMLTFFISPTVGATQDAGKSFMGYFMRKTKFNLVMWSSALLTVIAGSILYWFDSNGFRSVWMSSGPGIGYGIAAIFAFIGLGIGVFQNRNSNALAVLGGQIQAQGAPPSSEQAAQLQSINKALAIGGKLNATALILATIGMAIARYL
jgi:uncharacterized membrane protein